MRRGGGGEAGCGPKIAKVLRGVGSTLFSLCQRVILAPNLHPKLYLGVIDII